jgi:transcriptional regulator with XRE-family HTH domain
MPTEPDLARARARTAYWLRTCRELDERKPTLAQVAEAAGLKATSGSVVSQWENNRSVNPPKLQQLRLLAAFYGVPLTLFTEPPETDEERMARYRQLALGAVDLERRDWEQAREQGPSGGDALGEQRGRRSA